jgi:TolB-like protein
VTTPSQAVFLSYASQDAEAARHICDALRAVGLDVWFDQSELRGGDAWDASIRRRIKDCALFVPIISANTNARSEGYFRLEWKLAVDRSHLMADDQAFLLPVVIDTTLDANARVPEKFREVQWTHLPAGKTPAALAERVQHLLSGEAAPLPAMSTRAVATTAQAVAVPARESPSIAVLPFVNRSHDEEDEYFSDGLADELLNVLGKIRGLRVAARISSFQFKGKNDDIAVIGRKLHVATVLEGSVRKAGNRMRISVQLVTGGRRLSLVVGDLRPDAGGYLRGAGRHRAIGGEGVAQHAARGDAGLYRRPASGGGGGDRREGSQHGSRSKPAVPAGSILHRSKHPRRY